MEFAKEKKRHLTYLSKTRPRPCESQNVLTFTVKEFADEIRLEYMTFAEEHKVQHSWGALLAFWRYRHHTTDKTAIQSMKRKMEIKKKEEYTLYHNNRRLKQQRSSPPPLASPDAAASETTPPPPSPPKKKRHYK